MKGISILALIIASLVYIGSVGALEVGNIGYGQCILQLVISAVVILGSIYILRKND